MTENNSKNSLKQILDLKNDFLNELKSLNYSENTILAYSKEIDYFIEYFRGYYEEMDLIDINRPFIQSSLTFREKMSKYGKISPNTKKMYLKALYQFFVYITDALNGIKDFTSLFNKIKIQTEKNEKNYLNAEEIKRLLNYINILQKKEHSYIICRNVLFLKLLLYTGMRASEIVNLKLSDITTYEDDISMYQIRVFGKGKKEAYCYVDKIKIQDEIEEIISLRKKLGIASEYIFVSKKGRQITRYEYYTIVSKILKKAGINKKGLHIFRHTLGFQLAQKGVRIEDIQEILRHSNINTTRIYVQRKENDKVSALKKIDY